MSNKNEYIRLTYSYLAIRKTTGWIGILLPFVLMIGGISFRGVVEPSISDYYYTEMGDIFVGSLFAIALFMFFYTGYDKIDNIVGNFAGIFAIGTAIFPTPQEFGVNLSTTPHFFFASALFLTLAIFSLFIFTRGNKYNRKKRIRNRIYIACGIIMILSLVTSAIFLNLFADNYPESSFFFWGETAALLAFGFSWLTKGGTLYPDTQITKNYKNIQLLKRQKYNN